MRAGVTVVRRVLKPLALAVVVLALLWFMKDRGDQPARHEEQATAVASAAVGAPVREPSTSTSAPSSVASSTPSGTPSPAVSELPASTVDEGEVEGEVVDPTAAAVPRDAAQGERFARYERAAVDFLTIFARPAAGVSTEAWWAGVRPLLSEVAVAAYEGTDPGSVPFTAVTGAAVIVPTDAPADLLMVARVETDAGFYRVEMTTGPDGIRTSRVTLEGAGQ